MDNTVESEFSIIDNPNPEPPKPPTPLEVARRLVWDAFDCINDDTKAHLLAEARAWFELSLRIEGK